MSEEPKREHSNPPSKKPEHPPGPQRHHPDPGHGAPKPPDHRPVG